MPDINWRYQLAIRLRKYPGLHRPLRWLAHKPAETATTAFRESARRLSPPASRLSPVRGSFSALDLVRSGKIPGRLVLEDQGSPRLFENPLLVRCGLRQHLEQPWPIFWSAHKNARLISPSLALVNERNEVARESAYRHRYKEDPSWRAIHIPPPIHLPGNWTSLASWWVPNDEVPLFSHWIMDALPRLALLSEFPPDTGILVPKALAGYQKETLKLLGLLDRIRYTPEQNVTVDNYYLSAPTTLIACHNPYAVNYLRSALLPKADRSYKGPKRFLIRRRGKTRGILNEAEVHGYFERLGWTILDTESLTFAQELTLFAEAEAFTGVLGSGFTNAFWCRPGCKVIPFVSDSWVDGWVEWICDVNKLDFFYDIFPSDHAFMAQIDLKKVEALLRKAGLLN